MSKQEKSRKPLIIGIIAAVAILAVLLTLLLTQCTGSGDATQSTPAQTVGYLGEAENYDLYWNLDRALYDGKSEAGMSSRKPESDGYFHVRFFKDGEILELKVADRKTVNAIEVNDLMGLEFDSNGIVVDVISLDDMPLQQVGWKFYVQSIGGNMLKLNSAKTFDGMELLCELLDDTGIYDMTGAEGEVGKRIIPIATDRVIAIANLAGELTHVYIYERSEYMQSFQAECQHCKETVTWKMWNKPDTLPTETGHYQLTDNIVLKAQSSIAEDAKICLDLNGKVVDGADNKRIYSLHNVGANLALMDTSEEKTGVLRGHAESSPQGGVVWVRYGAFYMYGGTLDGSDMTSVLNGTVVQVPKGCFFYMYDGTIIGGTSMYTYNAETNKYNNGLGGAVSVSGKFVMHDGLITGGKAMAAVTKWNNDGTPNTYQRGIGGNVYVAGGAEFEMKGGTIQNGVAGHSGGNVYLDGASTMIMDGGVITGGAVTGKGRNGGNVFVTSKATFTFNGGSINWGTSYNCAANLYSNGTVNMNGGYIGCGVIRDWATNKVKAEDNRTNVFQVNGKMYMYGGVIEGGYTITDTNATDKTTTILVLGGMPVISGREELEYEDLVLTNGGSGVKVIVGTLVKGSKVGVNATTGIFTTPTSQANTDKFYSTIEGADIHYVDGCIALGRMGCVCGSEKHFGKCDGTQLLWAPINSGTIPNTTGNYYLAKNITISAQCALAENADVKLDLNGFTLTGPKNKRALTTFTEGSKLTVTDSSEGKTGVVKSRGMGDTQGNAVWVRYGSFDFYGGTLDGSEYTLHSNWGAGKDAVFGTKDDANSARDGGTVAMVSGTTFNMYGGTIIGNKAIAYTMEKTVTEGEGEDAVKKTVTKDLVSSNGASLALGNKCVFNMYDGVIRDGTSESKGGNIYASGTATLNLYGGVISGGRAGMFNEDGTLVTYKDANGSSKVKSAGWGGNIDINDSAVVNLLGVTVTGGVSGGNGGNIRLGNAKATLNMTAGTVSNGQSVNDQGGNLFLSGTANLTGGTVQNGKSKNGGNITVNSSKEVTLKGVTVIGGYASGNGGNIRIATTNATGSLIIAEGTVISGGIAEKNGGNISVETNNANKNNPVGKLIITGGTIASGRAGTYDENGNLAQKTVNSVKKSESASTKTLTINGKKVTVDVVVTTTETRTSAVISQGYGGNISLGNGAVMEMTGGKIVDGKSMSGGNLYANGTCVVNLKGGEIAGGVAGDMDAAGVLVKRAYTVTTEERLKAPEEYGAAVEGKEEAQAKQIENQKLAAGYYTAPAANTTTKNENICTGWGGNLYLYSGELNLLGTSISGGKSGGNGGSIYVRGKDAVLNMSAGQVVGGQSTTDQGGNIWAGTGATLNITGGSIKNGSAAKNGGNIHCNADVNVLLDNVAISGGSAYGKTNYKNANVNISASENVTIANVNIAGYVSIGSGVKLAGKPVITGGETNLSLNGNDIDITALDVGTDTYKVGITDSSAGIFTGVAQQGEEKYFYSDDDRLVGFMNGKLTLGEGNLGLGRYGCRCARPGGVCVGTEGGCDGEIHFWTAWTSTNSLPTQHGYWYLTNNVTMKDGGQANMEKDATIHIDLNGKTVKDTKNRMISTSDAATIGSGNVELWITDSSLDGTGTMLLDYAANATAYNGQGAILLMEAGSELNLIAGTLNASDSITGHNEGGAAVCVARDAVFNMYGGTVVGGASAVYGGAVSVVRGGTFNLYGGTVTGGKAVKGGNLYVLNGTANIYGGTIQGGEAEEGGNIYIQSDGMVNLNGGFVKEGKAIRYDKNGGNGGNIYVLGQLTVDGATVKDGKAGTLDTDGTTVLFTAYGWGGNIYLGRVQDTKDKTVYYTGSMELISGTIGKGESKGNGGSIYLNVGTEMTMSGGTVENGISHADQGGNIFCSGTLSITGGEIKNGVAKNGGNIGINTTETVSITGGTVSGGRAGVKVINENAQEGQPEYTVNITGNGGNIRINSTNTTCALIIGGTAQIIDGAAKNGGNIAVERYDDPNKTIEETAYVTVQGGNVTNGNASVAAGNGGNIYLGSGVNLTVTSGTISNGKAENEGRGGNIYIGAGSNATITGGTVSDGQAGAEVVDPGTQESSFLKGWGGNIMIKGGSLKLGGTAEIANGWANNNGGSINVESGSMIMEGGSVYGGTTLDRGGNIFVAANQTLTVTGGSVYNGTAVRGGNIAGNAGMKVSLSGVSIYGGTATNTTNYAKRFNMEVIGGTGSQLTLGDGANIAGGIELTSTVALSMSGKVIIDGGEGCSSNLSLNGNTITLSQMKADSSVGITNSKEGPFTKATDAAYLGYFFADNDAQGIAHLENVDKCLWLGHYDCLCAGAGENGACVGAAGGCTDNKVLWMPWTATTMPNVSGNWYLTASQVKYKQIRLTSENTDIRIDLNGKKVVNDGTQRMYRLEAAGVKVTLTDGVGTGKITNSAAYDQGGIFWVTGADTYLTILGGEVDGTGYSTRGNSDVGGTLIQLSGKNATMDMYGGIVKGGTGTRGLAVDVSAATAVFNMYGGEIIGGTATFQKSQQPDKLPVYSGGQGGAVYVNGTFNMSGGQISGGRAVYQSLNESGKAGGGQGDNVYVTSAGTLAMTGGQIVGGVDVSNAMTVSVSGTAIIDRGDATNTTYSLQLGSKELTVGELKSGAAISITADEGAFTNTGRTQADLSYFAADNAQQGISLYGGKLHLGKYACICGSTSENAADHKHYMDGETLVGCDGTKVAWTPWTSTTSLPTKTGNFYLTAPVAINSQASLAEDSDVVLDLNGYAVTPAQNDGEDVNYRIISLHNSGAKLTLTDTYTVPAAGSADYDANRTGGEIVGSQTRTVQGDTGCVVWVRWAKSFAKGGTFVMLGGNLTAANATSSEEGAVLHVDDNGKFYMLGGSISGGTTTANGGNVYVDNNAVMHMAGGSITNGTAKNGGNVCVNNSGSLIMTGGTISGGKSGSASTPTEVHADVQMFGTMTMSGGKIGAGVQVINNNRVSGASITLSGTVEIGKITLNKYKNNDLEIADIEIPTITINGALATSVTEGETTRDLTPIQIATYSGVDHYFATTTVADNAARFASAYEGKGIHYIDGKLYLGKYNCLCGGNGNTDTTTGGTCVGATEGCDSQLHVWTATASLPSSSGHYYLTKNVTLTGNGHIITTNQNIALDLNGYNVINKMTAAGAGRIYSTNGAGSNTVKLSFTNTYTGTDAARTGDFILDDSARPENEGGDQGRVVWMAGGTTTVKLYKVDINLRNSKTAGTERHEGAAFELGTNRTLELYNLNIMGGTLGNSSVIEINNTNAKVLLHNTTISGHTDGVLVNTTAENSGVTLSGNSYVGGNAGYDIKLISDAQPVALAEGYTGSVDPETNAVLHVTGITAALGEDNAPSDVVVNADGTALTYAVKDLFATDDDKVLGLFDGKLQAYAAGTHIHCVCSGNLGNRANGYVYDLPGTEDDHICEDILYTPISGELAGGAVKTGGNWYLSDHVTIKSGNHYQMSGISINLCMNGKNWTGADGKRPLSLQPNQPVNYLSVTTCQADVLDADGIPTNNRIISRGTGSQGFGVWVANGTFDFYAGCIDGRSFKSSYNGAIVNVATNQTMNMYTDKCMVLGGTNDASKNGATMGSYGTTNMYNGTIKNGISSHYAGNLHISSGVFNMYDGLITGGSTTSGDKMWSANGAMAGGTFNMLGGQIDGGFGQLGNADANNATLVISGDAVIDGGTSGYNLKESDRLFITVKNLDSTAKVVLDMIDGQTIAVEGTLPENWAQIIVADGYTAALNDAGTEITFTANTTP